MKGGKSERGYLGVGIQPVTDDIAAALGLPKNRGEIVARVEPDGPASKAGLKQGDVIVRVNGQDVTPDQSLSYLVANLSPGTRVPIELIRGGKRQTVTATMATRPSEEELAGFSRSEEHTSELQSLMRISYAVFCLTTKISKKVLLPVLNTLT